MHPESVGIHSLGHNLFHQHVCLFVPNNLSVAVQPTNCHLRDEAMQDHQTSRRAFWWDFITSTHP